MAKVSSQDLGSQPIGKILIKQAVPASIGILVNIAHQSSRHNEIKVNLVE